MEDGVTADKDRCFRQNGQIIYKENEGILIDPYRRTLVELNPVAQEIWRLCDGSCSITEILRFLTDEFDAEPRRLEKDVLAFLGQLSSREMIR
jgi:hypothetical protein